MIDAEADTLCQARYYSATRNEPAPAPDTTNEACTLPVIFRNHVQHGGQSVAPAIGHGRFHALWISLGRGTTAKELCHRPDSA